LVLVLISTCGCSSINSLPFISSQTPLPTYTLYPTYTSYPTYTPAPPTATPIPEKWIVKVLSSTQALNCGNGFAYKASDKSKYVELTIQYTYNGQDTIEFFPGSLELLYPDGTKYPGSVLFTYDYQPENSNTFLDFYNSAPIMTFIKPGQTKIEKWCWATSDLVDTKYLLLFPEIEPIDVTANDVNSNG
jgi:hypothetical protein